MPIEAGRGQPEPETLEREAAVPKDWKAALDLQEDFIEELLGGGAPSTSPLFVVVEFQVASLFQLGRSVGFDLATLGDGLGSHALFD